MTTLSPTTLMVAIQAVDVAVTELTELKADIGTGPEAADVNELLLSYSHAAKELQLAYEDEHSRSGHLPAYDELVTPQA
ncbi:MAG: hypothetical protein V4735_03575 [Pseudomonadota bacterium]